MTWRRRGCDSLRAHLPASFKSRTPPRYGGNRGATPRVGFAGVIERHAGLVQQKDAGLISRRSRGSSGGRYSEEPRKAWARGKPTPLETGQPAQPAVLGVRLSRLPLFGETELPPGTTRIARWPHSFAKRAARRNGRCRGSAGRPRSGAWRTSERSELQTRDWWGRHPPRPFGGERQRRSTADCPFRTRAMRVRIPPLAFGRSSTVARLLSVRGTGLLNRPSQVRLLPPQL